MSGAGSHILVFDVGSSSLKAVVFEPTGAVVSRAETPYARPAVSHRQSPWDWWGAAVIAARQLQRTDVGAISLTGTMENLIPISERGDPIGDALLYSNPCGTPFLAETEEALTAARATHVCGNAPEPLMSAFKLAWLHRHEPERYERAACFLPGSKDFLALKLTGEAVTDPTCAVTTGLMDIAARDWSTPLRSAFGLERRRLPHIRPATDIVGQLLPGPAEELGLSPGLPVINGCGDGGATTMGGGADHAADVSVYLGTTGWVARVASAASLGEPRGFYRLPHPIGEGIIEIAPILSAGAAAAWTQRLLGVDLGRAESLAQQADRSPGDAIFLPYLGGERSPFLDLDLRGGFLGLDSGHGPAEIYYATLEGVAFAIDNNLRAMGGAGRKVSLVGGGALSTIWPQIIADVLGHEILAPPDPTIATAFGALRIAQRALRMPPATGSFAVVASPRPERAARIERLRQRFAAATAFARTLAER
ncbi:MAG TPA: FGGY family carbohydrate kinase [Devosiaceae bacterium]|nr:FGGY family carbohydrate kinase [Devosiaceae bacterium]